MSRLMFYRRVSSQGSNFKDFPKLKYKRSISLFNDNMSPNYVVLSGARRYVKYRSAYHFFSCRNCELGNFAIGFEEKFVVLNSASSKLIHVTSLRDLSISRVYDDSAVFVHLTVPPFWIAMIGAIV